MRRASFPSIRAAFRLFCQPSRAGTARRCPTLPRRAARPGHRHILSSWMRKTRTAHRCLLRPAAENRASEARTSDRASCRRFLGARDSGQRALARGEIFKLSLAGSSRNTGATAGASLRPVTRIRASNWETLRTIARRGRPPPQTEPGSGLEGTLNRVS